MNGSHVHACLITNSRAGHGAIDLTAPLAVLHEHGWKVRVRDKRHGGQATELARDAERDGCDVVVACAGDGTVSEIVDGMLDVCLITAAGAGSAGKQLASLIFRQHPSPASAQSFRAAECTIEAPEVLPLQVDGGRVRLKKIASSGLSVTYRFTTIHLAVTVLVPRDYEGTLFQHQALAAGPGREKEGPLAAESGWKHRFRVVQVGADDFTAIQCGSGRTVTVRVPPRVAIEHAAGLPDLPSRVLAPLQQGDTVHIKGAVDGDDRVLAKRITVLSPGSGSS